MKKEFVFNPELDEKMAAWHQFTKEQEKQKNTMRPCVTISRQFGCQAHEVAKDLEKQLQNTIAFPQNWLTLDSDLLQKLTQDAGLTGVNFENELNPVFGSFSKMLFTRKQYSKPHEVYCYLKQAIRYFASTGYCIILGRGGVLLTQDLPNCLHVRLVAPLEDRVQIIMNKYNMKEAEASTYVVKHENQRNQFIYRFNQTSLDSPHLFHLVINTAKHHSEEIVDVIEDYIRRKFPESIQQRSYLWALSQDGFRETSPQAFA